MDSIVGGQFLLDGVAVSSPVTFTQADIIQGRVSFEHDGTETVPAYAVSVADGDGGSSTPTAATIEFTRLNDTPEIVANTFHIDEGSIEILTNANLNATDEASETPASELQYTVSDVLGGRFALGTSTDTPITSFSQADIDQQRIVFVHDDSDTTPSYTLTVTDGEGGSDVDTTPAVTLVRANNSPEVITNQITISEGETITLTRADLDAFDEESAPADLTFDVTVTQGGKFQLGGADATSFTLQDIDNGAVTFVHDDSGDAPIYSVIVTDSVPDGPVASPSGPFSSAPSNATVNFTPINDIPTLTANAFEIQEGASVVLTSAELNAVDEETVDPTQLIYTVDEVANASFQLADGTVVTTFTQNDINSNEIRFVHDDSELAPSYTLTVTDNGMPTPESVTTTVAFPEGAGGFINQNNLPTFINNSLTVTEGELVTLSPSALQATDDDNPNSQLQYEIVSVTGGDFLINGVIDNSATFNQAAITFGQVQFQDDGDETAPTYTIRVTDPDGGSNDPATGEAVIAFTPLNDAPVLTVNSFDIIEGELLELSSANLAATDADTADPNLLTYEISDLVGGQFFYSDDASTPISSFTQAEVSGLSDRGVVFISDPNFEEAPSFNIVVRDVEGVGTELTAAVINSFTQVDDPPALLNNQLTVAEGETVTLTTNNLSASDPDTPDANLTFTVDSLTGGQFLVNGSAATSFTQQQVIDGLVQFIDDEGDESSPSYGISVSDATTATPVVAATIAYLPVNDPPTAVDDSGVGFSTDENTPLTTPDLIANDSDPDVGDVLTITQVGETPVTAGGEAIALASGALLSLNADGRTFTYDPNNAFVALGDGDTADETFTYTVSDSAGATSTATVSLVINGLNSPPVANDDSGEGFSVNRRNELVVDVLANDTDTDTAETLTLVEIESTPITDGSSVSLGSGASVTLNPEGALTYSPGSAFDTLRAGETTAETFTYTVEDSQGNRDSATTTILVEGFTSSSDGYFNFNQYALWQINEGQSITFTPVEYGQVSIPLLFDETYYLANNPDIDQAVDDGQFTTGYDHFIQFGWLEGRDPSTLYDEQYYLDNNPDVAAAVDAGVFSSGFQHFILNGHIEGRDPSALFDQEAYLANNPDVQAAVDAAVVSSAFEHYVENGSQEGRLPHLALFEESAYLAQNPDIAEAVANLAFSSGYEHYLNFGQFEGRNPSLLFDEQSYLALNPDLQTALDAGQITSGFQHYIEFGRAEDRPVFA